MIRDGVVSVVIPCFNQGGYLAEAVASVERHPDPEAYEIVIVDDGSTDPETIEVCDGFEARGYHVVRQENQGLAGARNSGVRASVGEYILPLDADNRILPAYISHAVDVLRQCPRVGVVYGDALHFEEASEVVRVPRFRLHRQLALNTIDACAVYRRQVWEDAGGYDGDMPVMGYEDWDLWISAAECGWELRHVDEVLFEYRVHGDSMVSDTSSPKNHANLLKYMHRKHFDSMSECYVELWAEHERLRDSIPGLATRLLRLIRQRVAARLRPSRGHTRANADASISRPETAERCLVRE